MNLTFCLQVKRPRRHSVSSLSTQEEFFEEDNATNNADCNNCNKVASRTNGGDATNEPITSGRSRTTVQEEMSQGSSHALRHSSNAPVRYTQGLSIIGQSLRAVDNQSRINTNNVRGDSDEGCDGSGVTVDESVVTASSRNGWARRGSNEGMQCVIHDSRDPVAAMSEGADNPTWMIHAVATQYVSPGGGQCTSQHRHGYHNAVEREARVSRTLRVADEGTNTEDDHPMLRTASYVPVTRDETSGSESDVSTRRVLFPDASAGPCEYSPSARMPFRRPQFDNFSETGSYSPPRERRSETKTVGFNGRETDGWNDRVIFNTAVGSDDRRARVIQAQWSPDGPPTRMGSREGRRGSAEDSGWQPDQPLSPPKV